jgi:Zn-finger nucleic acid-binding protein
VKLSDFIIPPWVKLVPVALAALFFGLWLHRGDVIERMKAEAVAQMAAVKQATAEAYTAAAKRRLQREYKERKINEQSDAEHIAHLAGLNARYERLLSQRSPGSRLPAAVPSPAEAARESAKAPCGEGLWCVPFPIAAAIMREADAVALQLDDLITWHERQEGLTVELEEPDVR